MNLISIDTALLDRLSIVTSYVATPFLLEKMLDNVWSSQAAFYLYISNKCCNERGVSRKQLDAGVCISKIKHEYNIKDLFITECEVCTGKYLPEIFVRKNRRQILPRVHTKQTRLIRLLLYGFWLIFSLFLALCSSSDVAVYFTSEFLGFVSYLHSLGIHLPRL